jgi:hypothetical protein
MVKRLLEEVEVCCDSFTEFCRLLDNDEFIIFKVHGEFTYANSLRSSAPG